MERRDYGELVFMDGTEMIIRKAVIVHIHSDDDPWLVIDIYTDFGRIKAYRNIKWARGKVLYAVEDPWDGYLFTYDGFEGYDHMDRWITEDVSHTHLTGYLIELEDD